jgi:hypothetical protein
MIEEMNLQKVRQVFIDAFKVGGCFSLASILFLFVCAMVESESKELCNGQDNGSLSLAAML